MTKTPRNMETMVAFSNGVGEIHTFAAYEHSEIGKVQRITSKNVNSTKGNDIDKNDLEIKYWGSDNLLPERRERMIMQNNIAASLISKKAEILIGKGLVQMKSTYVEGKKQTTFDGLSPMMEQWLESVDCHDMVLLPAAVDYYMHGGYFMEIIRELEGETNGTPGKIVSILCKRAKYMRIVRKTKGVITHYAYCADWASQSSKSDDTGEIEPVVIIPAFGLKDKDGNEVKHHKSIMYVGDTTLNDGYYCHPAYWGGKYWIEVGNSIPKFHKHDINNSYQIRYHIKYPEGYFMDDTAYKAALESKDEDQLNACYNAETDAKKAFLKKFEDNMSAELGTGKSIHSAKVYDERTQEFVTIEIEVIDNKPRGEDLLKLFDKVNEAIISGQNIPPIMANIIPPGKTMSSGNEALNLRNSYIADSTYVPRMRLLKPILAAAKERGLLTDGYSLYFEDTIITKMDEDKSGTKSSTDVDD